MERLLIVLGLLVVWNFSIAQKEITNIGGVSPVKSNIDLNGNQVIYALPKNIIQVNFTVKENQYLKGPYANFASKYLNINEGVIFANSSSYSIESCEFKRYSVVDSSKLYIINNINPFNIPELGLSPEGLILSYNSNKDVENQLPILDPESYLYSEIENDSYLDLGIKSFMEEKAETLYRTVKTDSSEMQVPYTQKKMVPKTIEQNAEEAAAFIRKIRKRRAKLLMGDKNNVNEVDGDAMKIMLKELKQLEKSYLELFIGKKKSNIATHNYNFIPEESVVQEQIILCYFSEKLGMTGSKAQARKGDYAPIVLKSSVNGKLPNVKVELMDNTGKSPTAINYGLYYRVPSRVSLVLQHKTNILLEQQMYIAQKGIVVPLPGEYLIDRKFAIEFYPETGGIKSIKHNKE